MQNFNRRSLLLLSMSSLVALGISGCKTNSVTKTAFDIDNASESVLKKLFSLNPDSVSVFDRAAGVLIMPSITKAGFGLGGSYGEGVLQIRGVSVDYYSVASASYGFQLGAQQYSHVLFFMTQEALRDFRTIDGWEIGADAEVTFRDAGYAYGISSNTVTKPIYGIIFNQKGIMAGASLEGAKYSRLIRG
mgnify:FL=1